jgi:hypothetical protein
MTRPRRVVLPLVAALMLAAPAARAASTYCDQIEQRLAAASLGCPDVDTCPTRAARALQRLERTFVNRCVALNQIQALGSHNSYHLQPAEPFFSALLAITTAFNAWEYNHPPLDQQFQNEGVRQIELDVFADPLGGLYSVRHGLIAIGADPVSHLPELDQAGFKVLHIQDLDFETNCLTFVACLRNVKSWSDTHRHHLPIMIMIEAKDDVIPDPFHYGFVTPIPIDTAQFDRLDAEILSVFPRRRIITPDNVRHHSETLEEAILTHGWPKLGSARGKVIFMLDNAAKRTDYIAGHPNLAGRILFTNSSPGQPDAAFVQENDPLGNPALIPSLVAAGYVVRTRSDADTVEARSGNTVQRDAAIVSGAQWVSTDYPVENPAFGTGYKVTIPDGSPARCNPVNAPAACRSRALEY